MAKIGIEWVQKYHGRASNLHKTQKQAEGFYNTLSGTKVFNFGDNWAWDQDFEEQGVGSPPIGKDTRWVDAVHIVYFSGHGSPTEGPLFGVANHDDGKAKPTEVRWGNKKNLKWIVFDACNVLQYLKPGNFSRWKPAFKGIHYILGFHSEANDEGDRGRIFAEYLNDGWRVPWAWKKACTRTAQSWRVWAWLRADAPGTNLVNDHWYGKGHVSPDPTNPTGFRYAKGSC